MKTIKLTSEVKARFPTIIEMGGKYFVVSEINNINDNWEIPAGSRIAINLKDGSWFDFHDEFEPNMKVFDKGTKFEIEI